jgi:hypothetical protein
MIGLITLETIATLAVGASSSVPRTYTITQADIDAGKVVNGFSSTKIRNVTDVSGNGSRQQYANHYSINSKPKYCACENSSSRQVKWVM